MTDEASNCAMCGEFGRLHCADCDRTFCVEHVERHFAMGYFYLCAECTAQRIAQLPAPESRPKRPRKKASGA